jgi:hypothetical protein
VELDIIPICGDLDDDGHVFFWGLAMDDPIDLLLW